MLTYSIASALALILLKYYGISFMAIFVLESKEYDNLIYI